MAKRVPTYVPTPRAIHYPDPAGRDPLMYATPAQLAARQRQQQALYARWAARQAAIAERDRKVRRFWFGFGAVIALALLLALGIAGWLLWTVLGLGVLAIPALVGGVAALVVGGHRCITVVQHWH